jgi:uncharacterized protein (TIGR02594 family)
MDEDSNSSDYLVTYTKDSFVVSLPSQFSYLSHSDIPLMTQEAVKLYGTLEFTGTKNNPVILAWADEIAAKDPRAYAKWAASFYNADSVAWCGLFQAICVTRANLTKDPAFRAPDKYLGALEWIHFGIAIMPQNMVVGDIAVMSRSGGGHVTQIVGISKDKQTFYGIGGNQGDKVSIAPFPMARVKMPGCGVRRLPYKTLPAGAKQVIVTPGNMSAVTEA